MNKKGSIVLWTTLALGVMAVVLLFNGFENASVICLLVEIYILNYAIRNGINYNDKDNKKE